MPRPSHKSSIHLLRSPNFRPMRKLSGLMRDGTYVRRDVVKIARSGTGADSTPLVAPHPLSQLSHSNDKQTSCAFDTTPTHGIAHEQQRLFDSTQREIDQASESNGRCGSSTINSSSEHATHHVVVVDPRRPSTAHCHRAHWDRLCHRSRSGKR